MLTKFKSFYNDFVSYDKKTKITTIMSGVIFATAILCCLMMCAQITLVYIDDTMYADWGRHGIKYFFEKYMWHSENFNGRTFVHMCLSILMIFGEVAFIVAIPTFLATSFYLLFKTLQPKSSVQTRLLVSGLSILYFLGLYAEYINTTMMWMAGAFNYIFPLFIIALSYNYLLKKKDEKFSVLMLILSFICGATTEQYGMYFIGLIVLTTFFDFLKSKKINKNLVFYLIATIIGYLTIFMAFGTGSRFLNSFDYAEQSSLSFIDLLFNNCFFMYGARGDIWITIALFATIGMAKIRRKEKYSKLCTSAIVAALLLCILSYTPYTNLTYIVALVETIILCVAFCIKEETREYGKLLICGFGTFFMMSITMAAGNRTCVPFILTSIVIAMSLWYDVLSSGKPSKSKTISIGLVFCILLLGFLPNYNGFKYEKAYSETVQNEFLNAEENGVFRFDFDKTLSKNMTPYRYCTILDGPTLEFDDIYRSLFNISDETRIEAYSEEYNL